MDVNQSRLRRALISNFKSIKRIELEGLGSLALFMGRNNAGKSNILDSFKFLADAAVSLEYALSTRGRRFAEIVFRKQESGKLEFAFTFELPSEKRRELIQTLFERNGTITPEKALSSNFLSAVNLKITLGKDQFSEELSVANVTPQGRPALVFSIKGTRQSTQVICGCLETLCAKSDGDLPVESTELPPESPTLFRLRLGRPGSAEKHPISSQLAELIFEQFATLEWVDPLRRLPTNSQIQGEAKIESDASNLPDVLHWLYNNKPKQFRKIESEVAKLVPQLGRLYTPTQQNTATLGLIDSEDEDLVFSMDQMSFGTRSLIAIVAKVVLTKPGAWVCVEEPETYLHPQAQIGLFHFLREQSMSKRVFVATHSTFIAASCPIASLHVVNRDERSSTVAAPVTEATALSVIEHLGVKPSFSFEAEAIIFVENADAVPVFEAWMKKHGLKIPAQFIDVEEGETLHFFANARVATSKFVQSLVFGLFGSGSADSSQRVIPDRVKERLHLPDTQILTLDQPDVESYLLEAKAISKAFPTLALSESELEERLVEACGKAPGRQVLRELFADFRLGEYNGAMGARIANALDAIPPSVLKIFERIDLEAKPFWRI